MSGALMASAALGGRYAPTLSITSDTDRYNIRAALIAAGWPIAQPLDVTVTQEPGFRLYSSVAGVAALDTGAPLAPGSTIKFICKGLVEGPGGDAGHGEAGGAFNGNPGGHAINLQMDMTIDNGAGYLYAGGGGGGAAGVDDTSTMTRVRWAGGGGGRGKNGGLGAPTGTTDTTGQTTSTNGTDGTEASPGVGGVHASTTTDYGSTAINGGPGGDLGQYGGNAAVSYVAGAETHLGAGGAPGKAVNLNGHVATFIAGLNSTRVVGAVA